MKRRVVVTGMAMVTPLGLDLQTTWSKLVAGESGVGPITRFDASTHQTQIAAEVKGFDPLQFVARKEARHLDRYAQFAVAATEMAFEDAGLTADTIPSTRTGVIIGTGIGGIETYCQQFETFLTKGPDRVSPFFIPMMIANMASGHLAIRYKLHGPSSTIVTACASSAHAVHDSALMIAQGMADVMVAGGAEAAIVPLTFAGFNAMGALSRRNDDPEGACRPFDRARDGFVMGEGAGVLILEERQHALERGARIHAEVLGAGLSSDAYHIVETEPEGRGAAGAMRLALTTSGLKPTDIGYINAHATATPKGDRSEALAIRNVFGAHAERVAISSTKSMTGHLLGAAGAAELIITIMSLKKGQVPPTINLDQPDEEFDGLNLTPLKAAPVAATCALSNSFGFGGHNVSVIVGLPAS